MGYVRSFVSTRFVMSAKLVRSVESSQKWFITLCYKHIIWVLKGVLR